VWALQIERPDVDCFADRTITSNNAGDQNNPAGVALSAHISKYNLNDTPPGPYLSMNVSMICNSRRGITYGWNEATGFTNCPFNLEDCNNDTYVNVIWTHEYNTTSSNPILTNDSGIWVDLPQTTTFVFYGIQYSSQVWICTNGFASFDNSSSTSRGSNAFSNTIGSFNPCGERAVIAPLWTQLKFDSQSKILARYCTYHLDSYFVVIWKNALDSSCQKRLTFAMSFLVYTAVYLNAEPDLPSGEIWFSYQDVRNINTNYTMGIEDQEGCKGVGYTFSGSTLAVEGGKAEYLWSYSSTDLYIKRLTLQFQDSNSHSGYKFPLDFIPIRGTNVKYVNSSNTPDENRVFWKTMSSTLNYGVGIGGLLLGVGVAGVTAPAGLFLLTASWYDWYVMHQYNLVDPVIIQQTTNWNDPNPGTQPAMIQVSAKCNVTGQQRAQGSENTAVDASLETAFQWFFLDDYQANHTLTITANVTYGAYGVDATGSATTTLTVALFSGDNNARNAAWSVGYGSYGLDPLLFLGDSRSVAHGKRDAYYKIDLTTNFGTTVDVYPSQGLSVYLYLLDSSGNNVTSSTQPGDGTTQEVRIAPTYNGTYYIHLWGDAGGGFYNMTISQCAVLSVGVSPQGGGTTNATGVNWCAIDQQLHVEATPNSGYTFASWTLDGSAYSQDNPACITMEQNHALVACFTQQPPPGESCPFVSTWNGTSYVLDNNILPQSETSNGTDVTDYYTLEQPLVPTNGQYALMLSEFEHEDSFIDYTQLLAVDHPANVNVGVSPSGQVLTYTHPYPAVSAITNEGRGVTDLLDRIDGNYYQGYNGSYVTLNFGCLDVRRGAKLVIVSDMIIIKCPIDIQTRDARGTWQTVATIYTRNHWATDVIDLKKYLPDYRGRLMVRLCFVHNDTVDFVGLDTSPQARIDIHPGQLVSAISSADGDVTAKLLYADRTYAEMLPSENVQLAFNMPTQTMQARTYIITTKGHYYTITP